MCQKWTEMKVTVCCTPNWKPTRGNVQKKKAELTGSGQSSLFFFSIAYGKFT